MNSSSVNLEIEDQKMRENTSPHNNNNNFQRNIFRANILKLPFQSRSSIVLFLFFLSLLAGAFFSNRLLDFTMTAVSFATNFMKDGTKSHNNSDRQVEFPIDCGIFNPNKTCPNNYPRNWNPKEDPNRLPPPTCPEYFRWIYEDLRAWAQTGITREMVEMGRSRAHFRLVILNGKAYVETFGKAFQTRDTFTLWGILQLLRRYPGKVPDLELMFNCDDRPIVLVKDFRASNKSAPPAMFHYCTDDATYDIVFPDWSFWGWPEVNIKSWVPLLKEIKEGNEEMKWMKRERYAYWKGNPWVSSTRQDLLKCNVSDKQDWNARLYTQDWDKEAKAGYKQSNLADQCIHRFKIYIEGQAWSVSKKYIMACDSVTLSVKSGYIDFFSRGLMPLHHYWPITDIDKCRAIKFAVDWGNAYKQTAEAIGKAGSSFIQEEVNMDNVYDYMFHLFNEYSKLLKFKPIVPPNALEFCSEAMVCPAAGLTKMYMMESAVKGPADSGPCTILPPYDPTSLKSVVTEKENLLKLVESWEKQFWKG